ncbi:MAG TPA: MarR family transcriptional regulator, partial [Solirubrobacteraceae bacterium]
MSKPSDNQAVQGFTEAWDEFVLAVRRGQARGQKPSQGLTLPQYYLLRPLDEASAISLCELADLAGIAAPTATRIIDGLEREGTLRRERSPEDRRTVLVSLTPEGRRVLKRKHRELTERRQRLYEQLDPAEREQSERLLRHLA